MRRALRTEAVDRFFIPGQKRLGAPFTQGKFLHHFHFSFQFQSVPARLLMVWLQLTQMRQADIRQQVAGFIAGFETLDSRR
ncbi:hypothetical protein D3C85_1648620 [compost metagenome]